MNVFISWSGTKSLNIAKALRSWLPKVLQSAKPFISTDISKGRRWSPELALALEKSVFGVCCITSENKKAPWLLFEAGALAKSVEDGRLAPLLFGISQADLTDSPLSQFQATPFSKDEVFALVTSINEAAPAEAIDISILAQTFDRFWPELATVVASLLDIDAELVIKGEVTSNIIQAEQPEIESKAESEFDVLFDDDPHKFNDLAARFRAGQTYSSNPDFWETNLVDRRRRLGLGGTIKDWATLAENNPTWIWPHVRLAEDALNDSDLDLAKEHHATALVRATAENVSAADNLAVKIALEVGGYESVIELFMSLISCEIDYKRLSEVIDAFHRLHRDKVAFKPYVLPFAVLLEYVIRVYPAAKSAAFGLAYSISSFDDLAKISYSHYSKIEYNADYEFAQNNLGIVADKLGRHNIATAKMQSSGARGNQLALANISHKLIGAGFLSQAADAIEAIEVSDDGREYIRSAQTALDKAKETLASEEESLSALCDAEQKKFRKFTNDCIKHWKSLAKPPPSTWSNDQFNAKFSSSDEDLFFIWDKDESFSGNLKWNSMFFEGTISDKGGLILGASWRRVMIAPVKEDKLLCLVWSDWKASAEIASFYLSRQTKI